MYHAEGTHEAIVSMEDYSAVQDEMKRRREHFVPPGKCYTNHYPYSGLIVCGNCGKAYRRKVRKSGVFWICSTYNAQGKAACPSRQIPETALDELTADIPLSELTAIRAEKDNTLVLVYRNGQESVKRWKSRSRADSWTPEMKERAREREMQRQEAIRHGNS